MSLRCPTCGSEATCQVNRAGAIDCAAQLAASEATSEGRRKELLRTIEASNREWRRAENAEAQFAAVTRELSEAQAREVKNLELFFKENSEKLRLIKERDEARAELGALGVYLLTGETGTEVHMPEGGPAAENVRLRKELDAAEAENARLRAAIAPTAENVEAVKDAVAKHSGSFCDTDTQAVDILTTIAARAGVKLSADLYPGEGPDGEFAYSNPDLCRACGAMLLPENKTIADGCGCNSARGINHGLVAKNTCTCLACDPAQSGSSRVKATSDDWGNGLPGVGRATRQTPDVVSVEAAMLIMQKDRDLIVWQAERLAAAHAERDELLVALEGARQRCACVGLKGMDACLSCQNDSALVARIEGGK